MDRCISCQACARQCANEVHSFDPDQNIMVADDTKCVNCHRCVSICPVKALKIVKTDNTFKENGNWSNATIKEIYRQAGSGGVLLASWATLTISDLLGKLLINASQFTTLPLTVREPMEVKINSGKNRIKLKR